MRSNGASSGGRGVGEARCTETHGWSIAPRSARPVRGCAPPRRYGVGPAEFAEDADVHPLPEPTSRRASRNGSRRSSTRPPSTAGVGLAVPDGQRTVTVGTATSRQEAAHPEHSWPPRSISAALLGTLPTSVPVMSQSAVARPTQFSPRRVSPLQGRGHLSGQRPASAPASAVPAFVDVRSSAAVCRRGGCSSPGSTSGASPVVPAVSGDDVGVEPSLPPRVLVMVADRVRVVVARGRPHARCPCS